MGIILEFVLGTVGGLLLVLGLLVFGIKIWVRRKFGDLKVLAELADPQYARPSRLHLVKVQDPEPQEPFREMWAQCHALGFRELVTFNDKNGALPLLRAARHESQPVALVATEDAEKAAGFAMFYLTPDSRLVAAGCGPAPALTTPMMTWNVDETATPASVWESMQAGAAAAAARIPDLRLIQLAYERAYAVRMDANIRKAPSMAALELRAAERRLALKPGQLEIVHSSDFDQWLNQISMSALDHFRRSSKLDAVEWERMREDVHVVHDQMRPADVEQLLSGIETGPQLLEQFQAQGYGGVALYEKVALNLPVQHRRKKLGAVEHPLHATIFGLSQEEGDSPAARSFSYQAVNAQGQAAHGVVYAQSVADGLQQLKAMGLEEVKILHDAVIGSSYKFIDSPEAAAVAAKSASRSLPVALAVALWAHRWVWGPALIWLGWSLSQGAPYTWSDYIAFIYTALAVVWTGAFVLPIALYNQLLEARVYALWSRAQFCLSLLKFINPMGAVSRAQLLSEQTKIMAGRGHLDQALSAWKASESAMPPAEYEQGLISIYGSFGDAPNMIAVQRRLLELSPNKDLQALDLALSLVRYQQAADEAAKLIAPISPDKLSQISLGGYHYVRGLIYAEQKQFDFALKQYGQAMEVMSQYRSNPLSLGMIAEIRGFAALALKASGRAQEADPVWASALPVLRAGKLSQKLIARYESI